MYDVYGEYSTIGGRCRGRNDTHIHEISLKSRFEANQVYPLQAPGGVLKVTGTLISRDGGWQKLVYDVYGEYDTIGGRCRGRNDTYIHEISLASRFEAK